MQSPLLDRMGEFVGQETEAAGVLRSVATLREHDMVTVRVGERIDGVGGLSGSILRVDADMPEVMTEFPFEEGARVLLQWSS